MTVVQQDDKRVGDQVVVDLAQSIGFVAKTWFKLWSRGASNKQALLAKLQSRRGIARQQMSFWPRLALELLDDVLKKVSAKLGMGIDCLNVNDIKSLPPEGRKAFLDILVDMEQQLMLPSTQLYNLVALIPKAIGGNRPIGLMIFVCKARVRLRKHALGEWDEAHCNTCRVGTSALQAAYVSELEIELEAALGKMSGGCLLDLQKYVDTIDLDLLVQDGIMYNYPIAHLVLVMEAYRAPRFLRQAQCTNDGIAACNCAVVGGVPATNLAKLYMIQPLRQLMTKHMDVKLRQYIDDLHLRCSGSPMIFVNFLVPAVVDLVANLTAKKAPVSDTKSVIVATNLALANRIARSLSTHDLYFPVAQTARDLGVSTSFGSSKNSSSTKQRHLSASSDALESAE
jgi:hypothetical protein